MFGARKLRKFRVIDEVLKNKRERIRKIYRVIRRKYLSMRNSILSQNDISYYVRFT